MAEVCLESVTKTWPGGVTAVRDLDLRVAAGELVVLVGPSGCGKTTTLRMIAGLEEPTAGTIRIGARVVNGVHPKDRDIAMVFQDYALYPHMTVRQNLSFGLRMRKVPKADIERRVGETAAMLGLETLLDRRPHALSGGQQQRVAVGRAIVRDPAAHLFDEPLSNLDARLRLQMRAELKALHLRLKTTTVYVTHDQEEAMTLGDRLVVMHEGAALQVGPPLDVYREPANRFVAGFLGNPAMNFIEGRLERVPGDDGIVFTDGDAIRLELDGALSEAAGRTVGAPLVLGVRPEHLRPGRERAGPTIGARVRVTEPLGDRTDVYATTAAGARVIARVDADTACRPGDEVVFGVDPATIHLFEPGALGRRI